MRVGLFLSAVAVAAAMAAPAAFGQAAGQYVLVRAAAEKADPFLQDLAKFLGSCKFMYLATSETNSPSVRPVGFTAFFDNRLAVATSSKKGMSAQMKANPDVELAATAADVSAFARYRGRARLCTDAEVIARFVEAFPHFKQMYGDSLELFLVEPVQAGIFPMKKGEKPRTKNF
jgi:uncharacterized pyridoxamine 5'-phosphate oxidase family protein